VLCNDPFAAIDSSWLPENQNPTDQASCSCVRSCIIGVSAAGHHVACRGILLALILRMMLAP
jgi:hypothetical protein